MTLEATQRSLSELQFAVTMQKQVFTINLPSKVQHWKLFPVNFPSICYVQFSLWSLYFLLFDKKILFTVSKNISISYIQLFLVVCDLNYYRIAKKLLFKKISVTNFFQFRNFFLISTQ